MNTERQEMIDAILRSHNLSALIFWRPDELVLTLGYLPHWGLSFLVCPVDSEPVLFVPELEPEDILPDNITIRTYPWGNKNCADPWVVLFWDIKQLLAQKNISHRPVSFIKSVGGTAPCRMSGEQPLLPSDLVLRLSMLTPAGFKDCTKDILHLYLYKTVDDLRSLELTHQVAATAVDAFYRNAIPGLSEAVLAAKIGYVVHELVGKKGISFAQAWPIIQSGEHTASSGKYNRTTGKIIADGDLVLLEMSLCVNGYWADITRTAVANRANDSHLEIHATVKVAQQKALAKLGPGVPMGDVDAEARNYISEAGYGAYFNHVLGHHVGFRYHDPGAGLSPNCGELLQKGMVLTVEPGIYGPELNGGVRIEDNVVITSDGYAILSDFPRGLKV